MRFRILLAMVSIAALIGCGKATEQKSLADVNSKANNAVATAVAAAEPAVTVAATPSQPAAAGEKSGAFKPFNVYTDKGSPVNHFIASGWMGDVADISYSDTSTENPHSGSSCIKVVYGNKASNGARWAGLYWQNPANNWGSKKGGFDLTGATKITFWARGENGDERIEEFKMGGITGEYPDSDAAGIGPVILTKEWKEYTIDLRGKDLSYVSGGFCWATNLDVNPNGATFYIDDIVYE
jgi:hypothetical protein